MPPNHAFNLIRPPEACYQCRKRPARRGGAPAKPWRWWGTYLSERQWGTVREDYSADGSAWDYFPHDHARSRAYRWGEDGIAGFCDEKETLCIGLALWNGKDPILKERLFGLTNGQGNHGEDVKELYYYLDATPTCSYARMLYKYPQAAFPYQQLLDENQRRGLNDPEFELIDTGIFADDRYFDVFVEYAKADTERRAHARHGAQPRAGSGVAGLAAADLVSQHLELGSRSGKACRFRRSAPRVYRQRIPTLGRPSSSISTRPQGLLFCENETNVHRVFGGGEANGYFKDAFHDYVIDGAKDAVNPEQRGTKAAALYRLNIAGQGSATLRMRMRLGETASGCLCGVRAGLRRSHS